MSADRWLLLFVIWCAIICAAWIASEHNKKRPHGQGLSTTE